MERHKMSTLLDNDMMHQFTIPVHHKKYEYIKTYLNHKWKVQSLHKVTWII